MVVVGGAALFWLRHKQKITVNFNEFKVKETNRQFRCLPGSVSMKKVLTQLICILTAVSPSFAAVSADTPEPASIGMLIVGGAGLLWLGQRKKKNR
jgi:hypothetical protein